MDVRGLRALLVLSPRLFAALVAGCALALLAAPAALAAAPPAIAEEWVTKVSATAAQLSAKIDPEGSETTYRFEYGTTTAYGASIPIPDGFLGAGTVGTVVGANPQGLAPLTTYHYRVVALVPSRSETVYSADAMFTTQAAGGEFVLPDGRQWELVSPPNKHGAGIEAPAREGSAIQAATNGDAFTYVTSAPAVSEPAGNRALEYSQELSRRTPAGWVSEDITTPNSEVSELNVGELAEYKLFSEDLSFGVVRPKDSTSVYPPEAGVERMIYLRDDEKGSFLPLVTKANVRAGAKFGDNYFEQLYFLAATPDLSHVVFSTVEALLSEYPLSRGLQSEGLGNLYEWSDGLLKQINVLPDGKTTAEEGYKAGLGAGSLNVRNAVSADGALVVWTGGTGSSNSSGSSSSHRHLYMRDMAADSTVRLDVPEAGVSGGEGEPEFQDASSDGSRVFFTDGVRLTGNASKASKELSPDLYVFETTGSGPLAGHLTDLTPDANAGEPAGVQGTIPGASEDGSYVYFVANGVLAAGAQPGDCELSPSPRPAATCNLYVEHNSGAGWEPPKFVARLSNEDENDWAGASADDLDFLTARVSPDGEYLAFMSMMSHTGYDNRDAVSGEPDEEVYLYDAATSSLSCASCDATGTRPDGLRAPEFSSEPLPPPLIDHPGIWNGHWLAGSLPGWMPVDLTHALRQPRYLSDTGRLFFDSSDALVPDDVNGMEDVYEYEPEGSQCGSGSSSASEVFEPARSYEVEARRGASSAGCVALISSGTSSEESAFLEASGRGPGGQEGEDVFFMTSAQLTPRDKDSAYDIYDAHVCSAAVPCNSEAPAVAPCSTLEACRAAPSPQPEVFGAPGTATFSGEGEVRLKPAASAAKTTGKAKTHKCAQGRRRRHGKCVKVKRSKSARSSNWRAGHERRAGR